MHFRIVGPAVALLIFCVAVFVAGRFYAFNHFNTALQLTAFLPSGILSINIAILYASALIVVAVTGSFSGAAVFTATALQLFIFANFEKFDHVRTCITPHDVFALKEYWSLPGGFCTRRELLIVAACLAGASFLIGVLMRGPSRLSPAARFFAGGFSAAFLVVLASMSDHAWNRVLAVVGSELIRWDEKANLSANGLMIHEIVNFRGIRPTAPRGYEHQRIVDILRSLPTRGKAASPQPDVVLLMLESFTDPLDYEIPLAEDPIPFFHALQRVASAGKVVVPVYGGGTCNTEFELLTGCPMAFLPVPGAFAFVWYVNKQIRALPRQLVAAGYQALAVHPNDSTYWQRNRVYPLMGFQKFDSQEAFQNSPLDRGQWVEDQAFVEHVIRVSKAATGPQFIFGVSVAGHGPYPAERNFRFRYVRDHVSTLTEYEVYLQTLARTDQAIHALLQYYEAAPRRTVVAIFGDHHPPLAPEITNRDRTGFETPLVIWNNFGRPRRELGRIASYFLGGELLREIGIGGSALTRFGNMMSQELRSATGSTELPIDFASPKLSALADDYRVLQYDELFGEEWNRVEGSGPLTGE